MTEKGFYLCLFISGLFNDTFNISDNVAPSITIVSEPGIWKCVEGSGGDRVFEKCQII